jgi:DNA repair exonuclease SbcCD ATPase subunit
MKIENVSWKNFNSYGNTISRIDFQEKTSDLYLLLGSNGFGKSTIAEVITFALYGKVEKKNKSDLPNRINKNLWCRIVLKSRNKRVEIIRGVSPNIFEVKINKVLYDTSGNSNVQDYLELEIFDIPYQVFKNIIVLSINDFKSFLTMSSGDKRNIIDRLFGFSIINQMKDSIKSERKEIKDKIKTISDELNVIEESITSITEKINSLEKTKKQDNIRLIQEYREKIVNLSTNKKEIDLEVQKIKDIQQKANQILDKKKENLSLVNYEINSLSTKIKLYENSKCPTCGGDLNSEFHEEEKKIITKTKHEKTEQLESINSQLIDLQEKIKSIQIKVKACDENSIKTEMTIKQYKREVEKCVKESNELNLDYLNQLFSENLHKKETKKKIYLDSSNEDSFLDLIENILGEDGVKNLATKIILPSLNQNILNMSKQMHLPYSIKFNDKFDCIINSLGEEINPRSMSTGERKKSDFIIIIALLKLLKVRYPSLNILFLDEIFSSVDSSGVYEIIKILRDVSKENQLNTWVINHTELPVELFDKKVEVYKDGGFSKLLIETIV